jgi:glycosyltransferase involved in cell wall biosynthesis
MGLLLIVGLFLMRRFAALRSSLVYTVQDSFYDYKLRNQAMMVLALAFFKRVIFCSQAAFDSLPFVWMVLVRGRWRVVQNGADIDRVDRALADARPSGDSRHFTILSVGRLERVKDPITLLDAFATCGVANGRLVFVGAGALEPAVRARVAELGLEDRVEFTGLIPRDEVFVRCAGADLFVSASHGEGLPVGVVEAMASRCPVILSDIAPHREVVDRATFVPLVAPRDFEGFAREIRRFSGLPSDERAEVGRRCREHVMQRFTLPIMHAGVEAVYRELREPARSATASHDR